MTGPEHYREAEKLLAKAVATDDVADDYDSIEVGAMLGMRAQAHATLALAAATAELDDDGGDRAATGRSSTRANAWGKVL